MRKKCEKIEISMRRKCEKIDNPKAYGKIRHFYWEYTPLFHFLFEFSRIFSHFLAFPPFVSHWSVENVFFNGNSHQNPLFSHFPLQNQKKLIENIMVSSSNCTFLLSRICTCTAPSLYRNLGIRILYASGIFNLRLPRRYEITSGI